MDNALKQTVAVFQTNQGLEVRGGVLRLSRHQAVIEILNPGLVLQVSEVLGEFKILLDERALYSGRAVVASLIQTGTTVICEASLDENCLDVRSLCVGGVLAQLRAGFEQFVRDWGKGYRIAPEFKVLLTDPAELSFGPAVVAGAGGAGHPLDALGRPDGARTAGAGGADAVGDKIAGRDVRAI